MFRLSWLLGPSFFVVLPSVVHPVHVVFAAAAVVALVLAEVAVVRTRLESLCNQHRQSVRQSVCQTRFSYFTPLDFSDFLHQASLL